MPKDKLQTRFVLQFLDNSHSNMQFPNQVGFVAPLLLRCCVVVALLLKLPHTLCGELKTFLVFKLLDKNHSNMTFPDRVYEFCCCAVGALLLYCCCVVVEASPHAMR